MTKTLTAVCWSAKTKAGEDHEGFAKVEDRREFVQSLFASGHRSVKVRRTEDILTPAQADGTACVACGRDYMQRWSGAHKPVGFSHTGSQVFACVGECWSRYEVQR